MYFENSNSVAVEVFSIKNASPQVFVSSHLCYLLEIKRKVYCDTTCHHLEGLRCHLCVYS